jgi:CCR4-NOT transcriptional regulation complex NOT5 subunit
VIGVGVKNSTSNLLIANCDEFIFYDDLVRAQRTKPATRKKAEPRNAAAIAAPQPKKDTSKKQEAFDVVLETVEALIAERGEEEKLWGSMVKQTLKRRNPGFNESYFGFKSFNALLEEAKARNLLELERDEKSGGYLVKIAGER